MKIANINFLFLILFIFSCETKSNHKYRMYNIKKIPYSKNTEQLPTVANRLPIYDINPPRSSKDAYKLIKQELNNYKTLNNIFHHTNLKIKNIEIECYTKKDFKKKYSIDITKKYALLINLLNNNILNNKINISLNFQKEQDLLYGYTTKFNTVYIPKEIINLIGKYYCSKTDFYYNTTLELICMHDQLPFFMKNIQYIPCKLILGKELDKSSLPYEAIVLHTTRYTLLEHLENKLDRHFIFEGDEKINFNKEENHGLSIHNSNFLNFFRLRICDHTTVFDPHEAKVSIKNKLLYNFI